MSFYLSAQYGRCITSSNKSFLFVLLLCTFVISVHGQTLQVPDCTDSNLQWAFNSLGQSPCLVGAYLGSTCSLTGNYQIPESGPGFHLDPSNDPSECECSTVTYNLYNACAACQDATISPWTEYSENCTSTSPDGTYGFQIPPNTAVPAWAYQLVESSNRFNLTLAQLVGDKPENKTVSLSTSSTTPASVTLTGPRETGSPTETGSTGSAGSGKGDASKSPVGAIVGGVVGGVIGFGGIGALFIFFLIRTRQRRARQLVETGYSDKHEISPYHIVPALTTAADRQYSTLIHPIYSTSDSKVYNPEDPSTFPPISDISWPASRRELPLSSDGRRWTAGNELRAEI